MLIASKDFTIVALNQVVQPSSSRDVSDRTQSHSTPNATGSSIQPPMTSNGINGSAGSQKGPRDERDVYQIEEGQENVGEAVLEPTSSNNSQTTNIEAHDGVSTPPTSDETSSQTTSLDGQLAHLSQVAASQPPMNPSRPALTIAPSAGQKRTADGQVKSATFSPTSPHVRGHSRTTSGISNMSAASNRIGELSSELRTRLSYAMVKVNHGWQSNSIDEVESMASQKGSPTSSNSTLQGRCNVAASPRATLASIQGQGSNLSAVSQTSSGDFDLYSRTEPTTRTYESFWADHSATASLPTQRQMVSPPSKPLAPSADFRPTAASRRSGTPKFIKPPALSGQGSESYNTSAPRTPNRTDLRDPIQTPTQKTLQEQDAIETLLFMSSPGNSGNMGHQFPPPRTVASPQRSPLRAEFSIQKQAPGRRVGFDDTALSASTGSSDAGMEYRSKSRGKSLKNSRGKPDAIDRMLDAMPDSSSEDEDVILTNFDSPRRFAAGRV